MTWTTRRVAAAWLAASLFGAGLGACNDDMAPPLERDSAGASDRERDSNGSDAPQTMRETGHGGSGAHSGAAGAVGSVDRGPASTTGGDEPKIDSAAADLRVTIDLALGEHLILAAKATGAALGGRMDEFAAYGDLLNKNGTDIGALFRAAFGPGAETEFNRVWSAHNGFFVDYTTGVASNDAAKRDKAVKDLTETYVPQFAALISDATGLPRADVASLTAAHVLTTKAIVDAQAAKDWPKTYTAIRQAFAHMAMVGDPLSAAIARKKPDAFPGTTDTKAVDFRVALNALLQEHLYLASFATGAALGGRQDEFASAGAALNENGTDVGAALRGLYGAQAETEFNRIWSAHNGFFVDYTTGVATQDAAKRDKAVQDLTGTYVPQFAAFLNGATGLPMNELAGLIVDHVLSTKAIVDAQGAGDEAASAAADRLAGQHMQMLGDPLAAAIVVKVPDKF